MPFFLSLDCGLTVCKAAVFDENGNRLGERREATPLRGFRMDSAALWASAARCVREALAASSVVAGEIAAVGLSGHGNGLYALDGAGECFLAVSSMFNENQQDVNAFRESEAYAEYFARTSQSCWGGQPLQILRRLKKTAPDEYARVRRVLFCKDYLRCRLTGEIATDYSDFSAGALCADDDYLRLMGVPELSGALPLPVRCDEIAARVSAEAARQTGLLAGTPVAGGGIDLFCCMQGAGVTEPGVTSVTMGTWGIAAGYAPQLSDLAPLTQKCDFLPGLPPVAVVSGPTSCVNLDWFLRAVRPELTYDEANAAASSFAPGDVKALYLPYLYRDMARPRVAAGFANLAPGDTWREMLRAVYEGVCFSHRLQCERLARAGVQSRRIRLSGGATNSETWRRLVCDILKVPLEIPQEKQAGLLGAAMMAAVGAGVYPSLREAGRAMFRAERAYEPRPDAAYDEKYAQFKEMVGEKE